MNSWIGGAVALVLMSTAAMLQAQGTKADYERFEKIVERLNIDFFIL